MYHSPEKAQRNQKLSSVFFSNSINNSTCDVDIQLWLFEKSNKEAALDLHEITCLWPAQDIMRCED